MPTRQMNREQLFGQLASLDEQRRVREQRTENLAELALPAARPADRLGGR
jgi:hypothetical protein